MKRLQLVMMLLLVGCTLASCGKAGQSELDRGVSAIEDAMNAGENDSTQKDTQNMDDLREGTSTDTVATPDDFPQAVFRQCICRRHDLFFLWKTQCWKYGPGLAGRPVSKVVK